MPRPVSCANILAMGTRDAITLGWLNGMRSAASSIDGELVRLAARAKFLIRSLAFHPSAIQ